MILLQYKNYLINELNRSRITANAYLADIRSFISWLDVTEEEFAPESVTTNDIRGWLAFRAEYGNGPAFLRRLLQSLRSFFKYLHRNKLIDSNPTLEIPLTKLPQHLPTVVNEQDMENLLSKQPSPLGKTKAYRNWLVAEMIYGLGLRRNELSAINDTDIDANNMTIRIYGKRFKQRILPLPEELLKHIRQWQSLRDDESKFASSRNNRPLFSFAGRRISASAVYSIIKSELSAITDGATNPHALRHTFATSLLKDGADLNTVKELLGHTSLATTQVYTHLNFNEAKQAYENSHPRGNKKS